MKTRRTFLQGSCGAIMALPFLESIGADANAKDIPMRMVCIGNNFGFVPELFFPTEVGANYPLPKLLKPLEQYRRSFTVFSGLDHGDQAKGGHDGVHIFLSGIHSKKSKAYPEGNISLDQKAAQHVGAKTRYPSMQFACGANSHNHLSWMESGVAIPPVESLNTIFSLLFKKNNTKKICLLEQSYLQQQSILDLVKVDADHLMKRISKLDQERLDQFYTSVRELEKQLVQSKAWLRTPKPYVDYKLPNDADDFDFVDRLPLYYELMALALQTDSTRVITLEVSGVGKNGGGLPITKGYHQLTHHGKMENYIKELAIIEMVHTKAFAGFLNKISAIIEPNGKSLMNNTLALFGSGMGNANTHSNKNIPMILAGGGFKHGQHLSFNEDKHTTSTPACNLFLSMLQRFGLKRDQFNTSTGTLSNLEIVS